MLRKATELIGYTIQAADGDIGSVSAIWFDDERWTVRYFVVDTGTWLSSRRVLISPISVRQASWSGRALDVSLSREQVEHSPEVDTHRPVSRQHEADYSAYYGYPYYWGGVGLWGAGAYPVSLARTEMVRGMEEARAAQESRDLKDSHLRTIDAVTGDHLRATDGEIGHVDDFLVDDRSWTIRYLLVDTSNWLGGRHVLVAPSWVRAVSWDESIIDVTITREAVRNSPEYRAVGEVDRNYEQGLYAHYDQPVYWTDGDEDSPRDGDPAGERLARIEDCDDLEVAGGDPDVRGWTVVGSDGTTFGRVEHLIVDRPSLKVKYLEVGLEKGTDRAERRDVLVPLAHADLDLPAEEVRLSTVSPSSVSRLPSFDGLPIDAEYERRLDASFGARPAASEPRREVRLGRQKTAGKEGTLGVGSGLNSPPSGHSTAPVSDREQVVNRSRDPRNDVTGRDEVRDPRLQGEDRSKDRRLQE